MKLIEGEAGASPRQSPEAAAVAGRSPHQTLSLSSVPHPLLGSLSLLLCCRRRRCRRQARSTPKGNFATPQSVRRSESQTRPFTLYQCRNL